MNSSHQLRMVNSFIYLNHHKNKPIILVNLLLDDNNIYMFQTSIKAN